MRKLTFAACAALFLAPAFAQEMPVPKVIQGMQAGAFGQGKGQWQVEFLEGMPGKAKPPTMRLCTDNLMRSPELQQRREERRAKRRAECSQRLLKDTPDEAVIESECPDATSTVTMMREGDKSLLVGIQGTGARGERALKMRYTHLGACKEGQGAMSFDKDSEQCRRLNERTAKMDPEKACARRKDDRAECEQRMRETIAKLSEVCR